ncbi:hypothetical protein ARTHRO9AX_30161 [Arthrobacter sp. 9AX]|nr:hypothetical protein ARTHRO9AX_30161 [Arthrobacter sp. 9AX]
MRLRCVWAASGLDELRYQRAELGRRRDPEFVAQPAGEHRVGTDGCCPVASRKVGLDEQQMRRFPQRFDACSRQSSCDGPFRFSGRELLPCEEFQGAQPQLPQPLLLENHPVVIPAGQQVSPAQAFQEAVRHVGLRLGMDRSHLPLQRSDVHPDGILELQRVRPGMQQLREVVGDAPDAGAQVSGSLRFAALWPQQARQETPVPATQQTKACKKALLPAGHRHGSTAELQPPGPQQT